MSSFSKRKEFKLGVVLGSILPDIDIFILAFAYLAVGDKASVIHRSLTHSLLFLITVPVIIISLNFIPPIKKKFDYDFLGFGIGLFLGFGFHILFDMLYLTGVYFFWPFRPTTQQFEIGFPIVAFDSYNQGIASEVLKLKLIQTTDFYTDIFFFYIPILFLAYKMNKHKRIRLPFLIYTVINFIVTTVFVGLAFNPNISYTDHVVYLYYLGTFFLLASVISPILFRNVIRVFRFSTREMMFVVALLVFSQLLFFV